MSIVHNKFNVTCYVFIYLFTSLKPDSYLVYVIILWPMLICTLLYPLCTPFSSKESSLYLNTWPNSSFLVATPFCWQAGFWCLFLHMLSKYEVFHVFLYMYCIIVLVIWSPICDVCRYFFSYVCILEVMIAFSTTRIISIISCVWITPCFCIYLFLI